MPLTRNFKDTVQARAISDPAFRQALLTESIECMLAGDFETGKSVLRDYINATIGFQELGKKLDKKPQSLMRMLSAKGNPEAKNLFEMLYVLLEFEGIKVEVNRLPTFPHP